MRKKEPGIEFEQSERGGNAFTTMKTNFPRRFCCASNSRWVREFDGFRERNYSEGGSLKCINLHGGVTKNRYGAGIERTIRSFYSFPISFQKTERREGAENNVCKLERIRWKKKKSILFHDKLFPLLHSHYNVIQRNYSVCSLKYFSIEWIYQDSANIIIFNFIERMEKNRLHDPSTRKSSNDYITTLSIEKNILLEYWKVDSFVTISIHVSPYTNL